MKHIKPIKNILNLRWERSRRQRAILKFVIPLIFIGTILFVSSSEKRNKELNNRHLRKLNEGNHRNVVTTRRYFLPKFISRDEDKLTNGNTANQGSTTSQSSIKQEMSRRREVVKRVCHSLGLPSQLPPSKAPFHHPLSPNFQVFYFDMRDNMTWCPIYKAASTVWLNYMAVLAGMTSQEIQKTGKQISFIARRLWPILEHEHAQQIFPKSVSFMIVRHPLERLLSAYRDKLEDRNFGKKHGVQFFYEQYGKKIVEKYRIKNNTGHDEVIDKIYIENNELTKEKLNKYQMNSKNSTAKSDVKTNYSQDYVGLDLRPEPTFKEFVDYIINTDLTKFADDHWLPYYLSCTPCLLSYDVIIKFETIERDQQYLLQKLKLNQTLDNSRAHKTKGQVTSTAKILQRYFSQITKNDLINLYKKYELDFRLFEYTIEDYFPYVKDR